VVVAAGLVVRLPLAGWGLVVVAIALVVVAELLNAAIEATVDLISPAEHPLAKRAKDIAAAAVLVAAVGAVGVGVVLALWTIAGAAGRPGGMV
jgi:undecaprenol kinase